MISKPQQKSIRQNYTTEYLTTQLINPKIKLGEVGETAETHRNLACKISRNNSITMTIPKRNYATSTSKPFKLQSDKSRRMMAGSKSPISAGRVKPGPAVCKSSTLWSSLRMRQSRRTTGRARRPTQRWPEEQPRIRKNHSYQFTVD